MIETPKASVRQRLVSVLLFGFLAATAVWNLDDSPVRDAVSDEFSYGVDLLHLNQSWALFSPNPTRITSEVYAEIEFVDGSSTRFDFPDGEPLFGAFREYRWRKFERRVRNDDYRWLRSDVADWIAVQFDQPVALVVILHRSSRTPEPGTSDVRQWETEEIYRERFNVGA